MTKSGHSSESGNASSLLRKLTAQRAKPAEPMVKGVAPPVRGGVLRDLSARPKPAPPPAEAGVAAEQAAPPAGDETRATEEPRKFQPLPELQTAAPAQSLLFPRAAKAEEQPPAVEESPAAERPPLEQLLQKICQQGKYEAVALADGQGLLIGNIGYAAQRETLAAVAALAGRSLGQVEEFLELGKLDRLLMPSPIGKVFMVRKINSGPAAYFLGAVCEPHRATFASVEEAVRELGRFLRAEPEGPGGKRG